MVMSEHEALDRDPVLKGLSVFRGVTTANGNVGGTTLVCAALIGSNDFISNDKGVLLLTGNSRFQHKGATAFNPVNGEITVSPAFGSQVLAGTYFYLLNSSTAAILGLLGAVLTRIGDPTADTLPSLTAKWGNLARSLRLLLGTRWDAAGDLGTDIAAIKTQTDKLAGAELTGVHNHANNILWQTVFEWTPLTTRRKVHSIWMDFVNLTQNTAYRLSYKIDGVNYRVFDSNAAAPWTPAMDDGVLIDVHSVVAHDFKLEIQSLVLEGAARDVPFEVYYENME